MALPITNPIWLLPLLSVTLRSHTTLIALTDASQNTHNSLLTAADDEASVQRLGMESSASSDREALQDIQASSMAGGKGASQSPLSAVNSRITLPWTVTGATNPSGS